MSIKVVQQIGADVYGFWRYNFVVNPPGNAKVRNVCQTSILTIIKVVSKWDLYRIKAGVIQFVTSIEF